MLTMQRLKLANCTPWSLSNCSYESHESLCNQSAWRSAQNCARTPSFAQGAMHKSFEQSTISVIWCIAIPKKHWFKPWFDDCFPACTKTIWFTIQECNCVQRYQNASISSKHVLSPNEDKGQKFAMQHTSSLIQNSPKYLRGGYRWSRNTVQGIWFWIFKNVRGPENATLQATYLADAHATSLA